MTKEDFYDWKRHPVTEQVYSQLRQRIEDLTAEIVHGTKDTDPRVQAYKAGAVGAYQDMLLIEAEGD